MKQRVHYQKAYGEESYEVEILLDYHRPLTEKDKSMILRTGEELLENLRLETRRVDPKYIEQGKKERTELLDCFTKAGITTIFVREIPNGYCGDKCCPHLPWFVVTTPFGHVRIGWRKRVIHIEWTETIIPELADWLFPHETSTKEGKMIHAWGYEKAVEYLKRLAARGKEITG